MSRRRGNGKRTPLDIEFERRGLVRLNEAARELGTSVAVLQNHIEYIEWGHDRFPGIDRQKLDEAIQALTSR